MMKNSAIPSGLQDFQPDSSSGGTGDKGAAPVARHILPAWSEALKGVPGVEFRWWEPLARHTTFRVGGPVCCLARPQTEEALIELLRAIRRQDIPHVILGGGSNVLAPDEPWDVLAIQLGQCCSGMLLEEVKGEKVRVVAGAGVRVAQWLGFCLRNHLGGMEFLVGIPGTIGGALMMNAGTTGGSIADLLLWIDLIDAQERRCRCLRSELQPGYRSMGLPKEATLLGACFQLTPAAKPVVRSRLLEIMRQRRRSQPLAWPSAGCIYKNPPGQSAGALIEKAGLKGLRIGDAEVSHRHANWIINRGNAKARDILALMQHIEDQVLRTLNVRLEREIRVLKVP